LNSAAVNDAATAAIEMVTDQAKQVEVIEVN